MQQAARDPKRRRSCDAEEEAQPPLQAQHLVMSSSRRGGKAALGGFPRRQLSQTLSEPDMEDHCSGTSSVGHNAEGGLGATMPPGTYGTRVTWAEPRLQVFPAPHHSMLMAMHAEYTSITDELETVCSLLSPPRTPHLLSPHRPHLNRKSDSAVLGSSSEHIGMPRSGSCTRHISEMSNPEMAIHMEKEHLRDAEECDYQMIEGVIQRRFARQRNEDYDGLDKDSYADDDDLGSTSNDATELIFVAPPTRQQRLQQQYRSRS